MHHKRHDNILSLGTGFVAGVIAWRLATFLELPHPFGMSFLWLILLLPLIWIGVLRLGIFLARKIDKFDQFTRFGVIGITNALVDYGYLNILIAFTGIAVGGWFSIFKGASFIVANISSYFLNKYWAFDSGHSVEHGKEYVKFFTVSIIGLFVNVFFSSLVVNLITPTTGASPALWANVGAVVGSISALVINFLGYKYIVFKSIK